MQTVITQLLGRQNLIYYNHKWQQLYFLFAVTHNFPETYTGGQKCAGVSAGGKFTSTGPGRKLTKMDQQGQSLPGMPYKQSSMACWGKGLHMLCKGKRSLGWYKTSHGMATGIMESEKHLP